MRAVVMERGRLALTTLDDPAPGPGEILVRTTACGICGSDLHAAQHTEAFVETSREAGGAFKLTTFEPVVLGHEFCAEVVDYGPDTTRSLAPGTHVCSVPALLREPTLPVGYSAETPGGFAEYMRLTERLALPVPNGLDPHLAALTEPMAVGYHAVNKAGVTPRDAVLVAGCGPVGLAVIVALRQRGVERVVASDFSPRRRELAAAVGADVVVDPGAGSPWDDPALARTSGVVIFECIGVAGIIDHIFLHAPQNARIVVVGVCLTMDQSRPLIAINKELLVQYVLGYSAAEFSETLQLIADGEFNVAPLVTARIGLAGVADMFATLANPEAEAKVLVVPGAG